MCTAVALVAKNFLFGRTLDNEFSYNGQITVTPKNYPFAFTNGKTINTHYAITGMAYVCRNYPLYFDGMNEKGLCMAGLNFVGNAFFGKNDESKQNVAVYEFIPFILSQCATVKETCEMIDNINLTDTPFSRELPTAQLHWLIADKTQSITVECTHDGMHVYNNEAGVLTNNPPFPCQLHNLNNYMHLTATEPENTFAPALDLENYSKCMGAVGLPGDYSSMSRFVRAAFIKHNSVFTHSDNEDINQFFHILGTVSQPKGSCITASGYEHTVYSCCMDSHRGIYCCSVYENIGICAVDMFSEDLDGEELIMYNPLKKQNMHFCNRD